MPDMSFTRREFLQGAAVLGSAAFLSREAESASRKSVVILGAGISGLTAGHELFKAGHAITIIEARPHAGGRLYTVRYPFADQLYAEAGGEFIEKEHRYANYFIKHLGLDVRDAHGPESFWTQGKIVSEDEIPEVEKMYEILRRELSYINSFEPADLSPARELDQVNFLTFLKRLNVDDAAIGYMRNVVNDLMVTGIEQISTLHMAYELMLPLNRDEFGARIVGGNDQLATKLASEFRRYLHYGCPVKTIQWDTNGVSVVSETGERFEGDELIVTLPATCLKRVRFEPELPNDIATAIESLPYGRVMKTVVQCSDRFWNHNGSGSEFFDSLNGISSYYHSSQNQRGPRGLLTCYSGGERADALSTDSSDVRVLKLRKELESFWPEAASRIEGTYHRSWVEENWTRGGYAYFAPGQMISIRKLLRQPVDRIHFAGEHTADWQGYINGAIETGIRAASEIDPAIKERWHKLVPRESSRVAMSVPALEPPVIRA